MKSLFSFLGTSTLFLIYSCNFNQNNQSNNSLKPIVLGDSAQIVTEKDSQFLKDGVQDVKEQTEPDNDNVKQSNKIENSKSIKSTPEASTQSPVQSDNAAISGFDVNCGDYKITLGGNATFKEYVKQNPVTANMLGYAILKGSVSNVKIALSSSVKSAKAFQKSNYALSIKGPTGILNIPKYSGSTGWIAVSNSANVFSLKAPESLVNTNLNPRQIEQEVLSILRAQRVKRNVLTSWQNYFKRIISAKDLQPYFSVGNTEVRLSGTTAKGRIFSKVIRLDGGK